MTRLNHLEELNLSDCVKITSKGLASLPASLKKLYLIGFGNFTDANLTNLAHLTHLEELDLSYCKQITGKDLANLPSSLKQLDLYDCDQLNNDDLAQQIINYFKTLNLSMAE